MAKNPGRFVIFGVILRRSAHLSPGGTYISLSVERNRFATQSKGHQDLPSHRHNICVAISTHNRQCCGNNGFSFEATLVCVR